MSNCYNNSFGIIGGDRRQVSLIESIIQKGYNVLINGLDEVPVHSKAEKASLEQINQKCKYITLPNPLTTNNTSIIAPYSTTTIYLNDAFARLFCDHIIFCGMSDKLIQSSPLWENAQIYDYGQREDFIILNAVPTAEGAIQLAMQELTSTISGSDCLVIGFGNVGKALCRALKSLGAKVHASARKTKDLADIEISGYIPIVTSQIDPFHTHDIIFNTVPHLILDEKFLCNLSKETILIDLASLPGGIDFIQASKLNLRAIHALGLPGKVAPKTAGKIISSTLFNIIQEENI